MVKVSMYYDAFTRKSRPRFQTFFLKFFWLENARNNSNNVIFSGHAA